MLPISVSAQYIKDLSFKNLEATNFLINRNQRPDIDLALDINIKKISTDEYFEVEITINIKATKENKGIFTLNLKYAGIFHIFKPLKEEKQLLLAVNCPAIIFPFARKIIADITQDSGFQPLMIDPIDFEDLYIKTKNKNH